MKNYINKISAEVHPNRLYQKVFDISGFHRIQSSKGFHDAAVYCSDKLSEMGIPAEILSYPASEDVVFDTYPSFKQWDCREAFCTVVYPEKRNIADFSGNNISIIQKSCACDYRDRPLDVVLLDKGPEKENYEGIDLAGKIAFVKGHINGFLWAAEERGALGFIVDHIAEVERTRTRYDMLDVCTYTSFWWQKGDNPVFGFVVNPREGDRLASECRKAEKEGKYVQVCCYVDADLFEGKVENVSAVLKGESDEEILIAAHLCHPRNSANDNASGVAAGMEALYVIKKLIEEGTLPSLKRNIRLLLIPEFTGTYAWLSENMERKNKILAAINADMVGGSQALGAGPLTITDLPKVMPSYVCDLAGLILECLKNDALDHCGEPIAMFNSRLAPFSGGSDHVIFTDPKIGIPTLMLGQWPDKYYHTDHDTIDKIDVNILSKSASLIAAYTYLLANFKEEYMDDICDFMVNRALGDIIKHKNKPFGKKRCEFFVSYYEAAIKSAEKFLPQSDTLKEKAERNIKKLNIIAGTVINEMKPEELPEIDKKLYNYIPVRVHNTLVQVSKLDASFTEEQKKVFKDYKENWTDKVGYNAEHNIMYYMDGEKSMAEIMELTALETGNTQYEAMDKYTKMLIETGYVRILQ